MDVLGVREMLCGAVPKLNVIKDGLMRANDEIIRVLCAVLIAPSTIANVSVSITAVSRHQRNERIQHIRSFQYAFAYGRCRCELHPPATRAVRR